MGKNFPLNRQKFPTNRYKLPSKKFYLPIGNYEKHLKTLGVTYGKLAHLLR